MLVTVLKGFLSVSNMKIIYNFTLICTLFIIQFLNSQGTSKSLRSAKVLAVSLYLLSRLTRSAVAILWDNIGEALNLSQEVVHGSQSQGSDLEELWYLCPDPTAPRPASEDGGRRGGGGGGGRLGPRGGGHVYPDFGPLLGEILQVE